MVLLAIAESSVAVFVRKRSRTSNNHQPQRPTPSAAQRHASHHCPSREGGGGGSCHSPALTFTVDTNSALVKLTPSTPKAFCTSSRYSLRAAHRSTPTS
jgi:hypothetical protein